MDSPGARKFRPPLTATTFRGRACTRPASTTGSWQVEDLERLGPRSVKFHAG